MALQYEIIGFERVIMHDDAIKYFNAHQPGLYRGYLSYRAQKGKTCPATRITLKALWGTEMVRDARGFQQSLRAWGYGSG